MTTTMMEDYIKYIKKVEDFITRLKDAVEAKDHALYNREILDYLSRKYTAFTESAHMTDIYEVMGAMIDAMHAPLESLCTRLIKSGQEDQQYYMDFFIEAYRVLHTKANQNYLNNIFLFPVAEKILGETIYRIKDNYDNYKTAA